MNSILLYILKSTICISVLYLVFRLIMRKESSFTVNRSILLAIVAASVIIPLLQMPQFLKTPIGVRLVPDFTENIIQIKNPSIIERTEPITVQPYYETPAETKKLPIPVETLLKYIYLAGLLISFVLLIRNIVMVLKLFRKATVIQKDGYRLLIVDREVPSFAFSRSVVISQSDFDSHGQAIMTHEQAHIRLKHFNDLVFLEAIKIFHWFNPFIYRLICDLKDIHEFQADDHTLTNGIDATKYQLLIIQKGVGPKRFELANCFNHCQIKKRIVMMNKLKTSKAWRWKVAIFLPMLALLLMTCGKMGEKKDSEKITSPQIVSTISSDYLKKAELNHLQIFVNTKGKVFLNFSGLDNRQQLLIKMGEAYNIFFSPKELEEFSKINGFGVPMSEIKRFLNLSAADRDKAENEFGIPYDSGNNEFKNWVRTAEDLDVAHIMRIDIEGDNGVSYGLINKLIETLMDLNFNRYNLLLAEPVKASEIAFPSKTGPGSEQTGSAVKFTQSYVLGYARSRPRVITIILDKDNSIYYYLGTGDVKGNNPVLTKTDFSPSGIHELLINMNYDALAKAEDLRKKKENKDLSEEDFEKQRDKIFSDKTAAIVLIKLTDASTYGSLMNILDEMKICGIGRYAIIDLSDNDKNLISQIN